MRWGPWVGTYPGTRGVLPAGSPPLPPQPEQPKPSRGTHLRSGWATAETPQKRGSYSRQPGSLPPPTPCSYVRKPITKSYWEQTYRRPPRSLAPHPRRLEGPPTVTIPTGTETVSPDRARAARIKGSAFLRHSIWRQAAGGRSWVCWVQGGRWLPSACQTPIPGA